MPKNITSCIKDTRFVNFFFRRLQRVDDEQSAWMETIGISSKDYPFVSMCGVREWNMVRPAAVPFVFHTLTGPSWNGDDATRQWLLFGGDLAEPFDGEGGLAISRVNGRLYHKLTTQSLESDHRVGYQSQEFGLIRSSVAVALSDRIVPMDGDSVVEEHSGLIFETHGKRVPIPWLPDSAEPGPWGLPSDHEGQ